MQDFLLLLKSYGMELNKYTYLVVMLSVIVLTAVVVHFILHRIVLRIFEKHANNSSKLWLQIITQNKLFNRIAFTLQGIIVNFQAVIWLHKNGQASEIISTCAQLWIMLFALLSLFSLLDIALKISHKFAIASQLPLKGIVQGIKLVAAIIIGILMISVMLDQSPAILISGLGAMAAVLMLVFKDPILGLVAGIQLSANNMLMLGDWLEMPKFGADGAVIDIGLTTVKVQNWDNTITTIPTYALVSDAFKNWSGMSKSGGRRIKRSINIDATSIHFLTEDEILRLNKSRVLKPYIEARNKEISSYNQQYNEEEGNALNCRGMTNIGTFRAYLAEYLQHHTKIRKDMTLMVRQLAPGAEGMPLEIYAFTNTTAWLEYEAIQADIFDHVYAVMGEFGLRVYQSPTGNDMRNLTALAGSAQQ